MNLGIQPSADYRIIRFFHGIALRLSYHTSSPPCSQNPRVMAPRRRGLNAVERSAPARDAYPSKAVCTLSACERDSRVFAIAPAPVPWPLFWRRPGPVSRNRGGLSNRPPKEGFQPVTEPAGHRQNANAPVPLQVLPHLFGKLLEINGFSGLSQNQGADG